VRHGEGVTVSGVVVGMKRATDCSVAVRWASHEAGLRGLPLSLVHVWDEPLELSIVLDPDSVSDLLGHATSRAVQGAVVPALLSQAPDLLVLGGRVGAGRLSPVARRCLRRAVCPVVIVARDDHRSTGRVLAAVGYGEASRDALRWAAAEARRRRAQLVVVHAWQRQVATAKDLLTPARAIPAQRDPAHDRLRRWVREVIGEIDADLHATYGGPLDALLRLSDTADLIVLGRAARSRWGSAMHDSVGNDLGGLAPCPIVLIPSRPRPV
jgi:nucleotide-binding universal stress UspA family protein